MTYHIPMDMFCLNLARVRLLLHHMIFLQMCSLLEEVEVAGMDKILILEEVVEREEWEWEHGHFMPVSLIQFRSEQAERMDLTVTRHQLMAIKYPRMHLAVVVEDVVDIILQMVEDLAAEVLEPIFYILETVMEDHLMVVTAMLLTTQIPEVPEVIAEVIALAEEVVDLLVLGQVEQEGPVSNGVILCSRLLHLGEEVADAANKVLVALHWEITVAPPEIMEIMLHPILVLVAAVQDVEEVPLVDLVARESFIWHYATLDSRAMVETAMPAAQALTALIQDHHLANNAPLGHILIIQALHLAINALQGLTPFKALLLVPHVQQDIILLLQVRPLVLNVQHCIFRRILDTLIALHAPRIRIILRRDPPPATAIRFKLRVPFARYSSNLTSL